MKTMLLLALMLTNFAFAQSFSVNGCEEGSLAYTGKVVEKKSVRINRIGSGCEARSLSVPSVDLNKKIVKTVTVNNLVDAPRQAASHKKFNFEEGADLVVKTKKASNK